MIKKFLVKLINYGGTRENNPQTIHNSIKKADENSELAKERHKMIMESREDRKYVSERTVPPEEEIRGPSEGSEKV